MKWYETLGVGLGIAAAVFVGDGCSEKKYIEKRFLFLNQVNYEQLEAKLNKMDNVRIEVVGPNSPTPVTMYTGKDWFVGLNQKDRVAGIQGTLPSELSDMLASMKSQKQEEK